MICTQCGFDNPSGNKYCQICGNNLSSQPGLPQHGQATSPLPPIQQPIAANPIGDPKKVLLGFSPLNNAQNQNQEFDNPPSQPPKFSPQIRQTLPPSEQVTPHFHQQPTPPIPPHPAIPQQASMPAGQHETTFPPLPPMPAGYDQSLDTPPLPPMPTQFQQAPHPYSYPSGAPQAAPQNTTSYSQHASRPNAIPLILSALAIIALIAGYFLPLVSARFNDSGMMGLVMSDLIGSEFEEFKNFKLSYSPSAMMLKKPPQISAGKFLTNEESRILNQEMHEGFSDLNSLSRELGMIEEVGTIEKVLSKIRMVGIVLLILMIGIIIALTFKLLIKNSPVPKFVLVCFVSLMLIALIGGLIYISTLRISLGELGGLMGMSSVKLSLFIKISPMIGYFLLVGGSISALVSALIKRS